MEAVLLDVPKVGFVVAGEVAKSHGVGADPETVDGLAGEGPVAGIEQHGDRPGQVAPEIGASAVGDDQVQIAVVVQVPDGH